jgi:membrane protein
VILYFTPFLLLSLGFGAFYMLMPNTSVRWKAALVGGAVGGCLWQINNMLNVIYVSRAVTYSSIYGSLGVLPLFLVGLYFSWLIMLFGAQVAYAFQNRRAYIQERQAESVNQRGREFIAMRLMTRIAENFLQGEKPLSSVALSRELSIPGQLVSKIISALVQSGLLIEATTDGGGYAPARPLDQITTYDVLSALRAGQGLELATKDDAARIAVRSEFEKVIEAEREAGSVTLETLARRGREQRAAIAV